MEHSLFRSMADPQPVSKPQVLLNHFYVVVDSTTAKRSDTMPFCAGSSLSMKREPRCQIEPTSSFETTAQAMLTAEQGREGIVAKRKDARYEASAVVASRAARESYPFVAGTAGVFWRARPVTTSFNGPYDWA
jgi:hypothetical protein